MPLDELNILPNQLIILIPRNRLRHPNRRFRLIPIILRTGRRVRHDALGALIEGTVARDGGIDGEDDGGAAEGGYFFDEAFGGGAVFVEVELRVMRAKASLLLAG